MIRCLLVFLCGLVACGDDDGMPPIDGGRDVEVSDCVHVETGATGGDGSEAAPFGSLAEALAASGERICLGSGAFEVPRIDRAVTLEGQGSDQTLLSGSIACNEVGVLDPFDDGLREDVEVVVVAEARLTLRDLRVEGCAVGLHARDVIVDLDSVEFQDVQSSLVLEGSAQANIRSSTLRTGTVADAPAVLRRAVVQATPGSTFSTDADTSILASGGNFGVLSRGGNVSMTNTTVLAGNAGLWIQDAVSANFGPELEVRGQIDDGAFFGHNRVQGGVASFDGVVFQGPSVAGLVVEGADVELARTRFAAIAGFGLVASSGTVEIGEQVGVDLMSGATGIYVGTEPPTASTVTVAGALASIAQDGAIHVYVRQGGALIAESGTLDLEGGRAGIFVADGGAADFAGSITLNDIDFGTLNRGTAELALANVTGTNLDVGVAATVGATAIVGSSTFTDVGIGVYGDGARLQLDGVTVTNATERGIALLGAAHPSASTLDNVTIDGSGDVGFQISGPHQVTITGGRFEGARRGGIEASLGADVDVDGSELRANERMGIAFYDAQGSVMNARFGGTLLQGGRADEIRITAAEGTTREVEIGSLNFDLDVPRDCSGGGCVLMLANGGDAIGIVTPNCIVESAGEAATFTTIEENGGTFTLVGPSAWASVLAGRNFDLGLSSGSATVPPRASTPDDPTAPPPSPL